MILETDSEGPDLTARVTAHPRSLIWDFAVAQSDLGLRCPRIPGRHMFAWPGSVVEDGVADGILCIC